AQPLTRAYGWPAPASQQPRSPPSEATPEILRADFVVRELASPSGPCAPHRWTVPGPPPARPEQGPIFPFLRPPSGASVTDPAIEDCFGTHAPAPSELRPVLPVA